jgi:Flp pilus assembly protein TadD
MLRRHVKTLFLTIVLIFAMVPQQPVRGIASSDGESATESASETPETDIAVKANRGNGFLRALKAPFRAIGRIFSRGKKDNNKIQRITAKDIKKFESHPANATPAGTVASPPQPSGSGSALEHMEKGRALLNSGNLNGAIAELSTAVSLDPKLTEAHTLLGIAYDRKGLNDLARQSLEKARNAPDDQAMHLNNLGYLEYRNGDYKDAIKHLKQATKLAPDDRTIWNNLGLAQAELGKFDDAYKSFAHAAGEFNGRLNIATRLELSGSRNEAIKHLRRALALQPNSAVVLGRLATLYEQTGRHELAEEARRSLAASTVANALPK